MWYIGQSILDSWPSVYPGSSRWTETEPTHIALLFFWDAIKSETWLRLPQACLEFEVKQCWVTLPIAVAPSHFQPAMSTGPASWNAGAAATHGDQTRGSALSAVGLSQCYLAVISRISSRYASTRWGTRWGRIWDSYRAETALVGKVKENCGEKIAQLRHLEQVRLKKLQLPKWGIITVRLQTASENRLKHIKCLVVLSVFIFYPVRRGHFRKASTMSEEH